MSLASWETDGPKITKWQEDFIFKRMDEDLVIACTGVGCGKSLSLAIWIVHQCINKPGIRGLIVAQTFGALKKVLVGNIVEFSNYVKFTPTVRDNGKEITFPNGSKLFGFSAENPNGVLGLSEIALLAIDEAAYCNEEIYNFCSDRMRGSQYKPMVRLISSPNVLGRVENWFSVLCKKNPTKVIHATTYDSIKIVGPEYLEALKNRYGEGTNLFRQQVLGEIFDVDIASQIVNRRDFIEDKHDSASQKWLGSDMAGLGADSNAYVVIDKFGVVEYKTVQEQDTFQKTESINSLWDKHSVISGCIDATGGYGQGAEDLLKKQGRDVLGVNFADKATDPDKYPNVRTQMYLELAEEVKNGFWIPEEARGELLAQSVTINNKGKLALIPKADIKKVLGHSPDLCDAIALSVFAMRHSAELSKKNEEADATQSLDDYLWWHEVLS